VLRSPQTPQALLEKAHVPSVFSNKKRATYVALFKDKLRHSRISFSTVF